MSSAMTDYTVASSSSDIKLWDLPKQAELHSFSPHKGTVNCVLWNHNNQVLVSAGDDGDVVLSHQSGRCLGRLPTDTVQGKQPSIQSLAFSSGSRYLCSGGASQMVDVWDLKKKERTRSFQGHTAPITAIVFGKSDARVASASQSGDILVHSVVTETTVCKVGSGPEPVRHLEYSLFRSHLLASGGDAASLNLWDTNTSTLVKSFSKAHQEPINQVGFSPVSSSLLSSVSFDKRMLFYDLNTQRVVKEMTTDYPLTCFNFHGDGVTVAVGTMNGHLLSYDLRKSDQPSHKISNAHSGPINSVKFQNARIKSRRESGNDVTYTTPAPTYNADAPPPSPAIFSPLKDGQLPTPGPVTGRESLPMSFATPIARRTRGGEPPSPAAFASPAVVSERPPLTAVAERPERHTPLPTPAGDTAGHHGSHTTPAPRTTGGGMGGGMGGATPVQAVAVVAGLGMSREVHETMIRVAVGEAVSELRLSLKEDINNLHLELLRQFHVQQVEIRAILTGFTDKHTGLVEEVKALRKDYEELKHIF